MFEMKWEEHRLLSPPIKVHWAGWESDTLRLSRAGWDISVDQDIARDVLRIALRHTEGKVYGWSQPIQYRDLAMESRGNPGMYMKMLESIGLQVMLANDLTITIMEPMPLTFEPGEMVPSFSDRKIQHIEDFKIFKTQPKDAQEVLLDMPTLDEVLKYACKLQEPKQKEIRAKQLAAQKVFEGARPDSDVKAELRLIA
jgi:hypothetical protein